MGSYDEDFKCENCGEVSVFCVTDFAGPPPDRPDTEIRVYIHPGLPDEKILHTLELKKTVIDDQIIDIDIKCPACGAWSMNYGATPYYIRAYVSIGEVFQLPASLGFPLGDLLKEIEEGSPRD